MMGLGWSGLGEVVERLGRGVADRGHRPIQDRRELPQRESSRSRFRLHGLTFPQNPDSPEAKLTKRGLD